MAQWNKLALALIVIGLELDLFALNGYPWQGADKAVEALEICGFICYLTALLIALLFVFGDLKGNQAAGISLAVFCFVATLFILIGLIVFATKVAPDGKVPHYPTTFLVSGAALALIGGIFACLGLRS